MAKPQTRYAKTADGVHIAYQARGAGPLDAVFIPGFVSNLEVELEEPHIARMVEAMERHWRVILFDKRGCGLSDRTNTPDLEKRVDDLRAVLDAVESTSAILFGQGEGGALASFFAATYPERVAALIPMFSWARIAWAPDYPFGMTREEYVADTEAMMSGWGTLEYAREWASLEMPNRVNDEAFIEWFARGLRHAASPATALEFQKVWYATDVRSVLGSIQSPTLVISGDEYTGAGDIKGLTHYLVSHIPGARLLTLHEQDFPPFGKDPAIFVDAVAAFVDEQRAEQAEFDRVLATVLFTDIVGSTERAAQLGDHLWKDVLERHHQTVRAMLARYRGEEVATAGDGFIATFDGPGRAVRCAEATIDALRALDLEIRAGVHTGEIERMGDYIGGMAVHVGARVCALAEASEILVSPTVRDLTVGSGISFESVGERALKGVPDPWELFRVVAPRTPDV